MNKQIILICQGRSGSTTLMRILNLNEGCNICGENWNMVGNILDAYESLKKTVKQPGFTSEYNNSSYPSWYNVFDFEEMRESIRQLIIKMYKGNSHKIWGFKEIRFGLDASYEEFETQLDNFKDLFPDTKFLFLYREDIEAQLLSGWWAENSEESRLVLENQLEYFRCYNSVNPIHSYLLSMEDMIMLSENFSCMFTFLDLGYDIDKIRSVLDNKLDYEGNKS